MPDMPDSKQNLTALATSIVDNVIGSVISVFRIILSRLTGNQLAPEAMEGVDEATKKKRRIIGITATVLIFGSICSLIFTQCERPPHRDLRPFLLLGDVLATETAKLVGDKSSIVLVVMDAGDDTSSIDGPNARAFMKSIAEHGDIKVLAVEKLSMNEGLKIGPGRGFPSSLLFSIIGKYPKAAAIVSLVGPPLLSDEEMETIGKDSPKIVVASNDSFNLKKLFDNHVIQLAVARRKASKAGSADPSAGGFDQSYEILRPETVESPAPEETKAKTE